MELTRNQNSTPIVGAWKLTSFEIRRQNGEVVYPFGKDAHGVIIYTESGYFSVQVMRPDRPQFAMGDQMKGTTEEIKANYEGVVSYYGSYECDTQKNCVTHHVEGSLFPNWEGQQLKRFFELSDNRLKLSTPPTVWGGEIVASVIWERVE